MTAIAAPADKRFRRAHVKPARRRRWYARLKPVVTYGALVAATAWALYRGGDAVIHADALKIGSVNIEGNHRLSNPEVLALLKGLAGESIVLCDLPTWRERLLESPWIRDVALRRVLPASIQVFVSERQPMAIARLGDGLFLVDASGMVLDEYGPAYSELDLPIVDGLGPKRSAPGTLVDSGKSALAARLIEDTARVPAVAARISQIDVRDARNAKVILSADSAMIYLGDDNFLARIQTYLELGQALREHVPDIDYVDLRFPKIYVGSGRRSRQAVTVAVQTKPT